MPTRGYFFQLGGPSPGVLGIASGFFPQWQAKCLAAGPPGSFSKGLTLTTSFLTVLVLQRHPAVVPTGLPEVPTKPSIAALGTEFSAFIEEAKVCFAFEIF